MHDIDLIDETFSRNLTHNYHLVIQTGLNGLSFAILDLNKLKYVVLRHYPFEGVENNDEIASYLSIIYKQDDLLQLNYKQVSHEFIGNISTLIPQPDFEESKIEDYLHFIYREITNQVIAYNVLSSDKYYNIFSYPTSLHAEIKKCFPGIKLFSHTTSFVEYLISQSLNNTKKLIYVCLNEGLLNIGIAQNAELLFFNAFQYKETSDIVYFILSVLDQYNLSAKLTEVNISADVTNHDELFDFLNNYLGQIHFIKPSQQFSYSYLFDELHLTRFTNLFNLVLCE
jgi:hypothetical protein